MRVPKRNVFVCEGTATLGRDWDFLFLAITVLYSFDFFCPLIDLSKREIPLSDPRSCTLAPPFLSFPFPIQPDKNIIPTARKPS